MTSTKYIGMDVHKESISIAVRTDAGKIVMECVTWRCCSTTERVRLNATPGASSAVTHAQK
jgi:hypothetical protein